MVGDRQRIAVLTIGEQELALVVGTPQLVGALPQGQSRSLRAPSGSAAALNQAMAIEQRMDGTVGRNFDPRKSADQPLANLSSTPGGVLVLQVQDVILYLEGQLVRIVMGTPASICEPLNAAFLITIEDLVTRLTGNPKLSAKFRHRLAG